MQVQLNSIGQIAIPVNNMENSVIFYRDKLGLKFLFQAPPGLAFFDCGGVRIMLDEPAAEKAGNASILYFKVEDIEATYKAMIEKDVAFNAIPHLIAKMNDHELWMAFFLDPDKNQLALMSEKKKN